jgi:hypothetical protein
MRCRHLYGIFHPSHCTLECVSWSFFLWRIILRKRRGNPAGGNAVMVSFHVSLVSIQPLVLLVPPPPPNQVQLACRYRLKTGARHVVLRTWHAWIPNSQSHAAPFLLTRGLSSVKQQCTFALSSFRWYHCIRDVYVLEYCRVEAHPEAASIVGLGWW